MENNNNIIQDTDEVESVPFLRANFLYHAYAILGEGAYWSTQDELLYWIDIEGRKLFAWDPRKMTNTVTQLSARPGTVVQRTNGELLIALQGGIVTYNTVTKESKVVAHPDKNVHNRYNDGKCDPQGRFWIGTMNLDASSPTASLYTIGDGFNTQTKLSNVRISNGIIWSLDSKKMYYIDTPTLGVDEYDFDAASGTISNKKRIITFSGPDGSPDGMTIDAQGNLWIAHWEGGKVSKWNPNTGKRLLEVLVPNVTRVTSVAFGGPNLATLYITTARESRQPSSGALFQYQFLDGTKGVAAHKFRG
ncbi:hypothetical protein CYY_002372 [Polysphondylium violaceum]|uniref:SMP-30/Gluconolactonase/LRE-like region domain-containing protein n=1 Tax=Polysphondylium violaceum TaxID=133409 RepID=A0A8J4Q7Y7_9MYCE|nr:hypothetical protein CYY_002372 [Polysphondylium violaceum]